MSEKRLSGWWYCVIWLVCCICGFLPQKSQAARHKVLVVFSYHDGYPWQQQVREGIESVLADSCEFRYFSMDTKRHLKGGEQKAGEAYELYRQFQPDGVITVDDNVQSMFVVPYLKDKVKTPVMFCGVNAEPEKYGYPASNVSGILERYHMRESIDLAQQLVPSIKTVGYIMKDNPTASAACQRIQKDSANYPAHFVAFKMPKTLEEAVEMTNALKTQCDALFIGSTSGIQDDKGAPLSEDRVLPVIAETFGKPTITNNLYRVRYGALCTVVHMGQEQGEISARMLLRAMRGEAVSEIPVTKNEKGEAVINVTVLKALGIRPDPSVLTSARLVRTQVAQH
ncbi:ABC transporter substrate-binding protein [Desulfonema ishimotonii]|uniref:ABC transporter substrate-binding protein n=1 Tax=Desulfonema ishimotonii TaxID=45657 RepID=A0A401G1R1_9BACT|nr:ABC transporter substrate binding protein [Desulfonema ishimotonii]GBC63151.1 ABC transporter substrate-binding protein [Desulfonema ishimotonii]